MLQTTFKKSSLESLTLTETINNEALELLINSNLLNTVGWQEYENEKEQLKAYKKIVKGGKAQITYNRTKGYKYGRVYAKKNLGLVGLRREVRHTLANGLYVDVDIVNCHPVLLSQICEKNDIKCDKLCYYINNRTEILESIMKTYSINKDTAKNLFIRLLYFGSYENWAKDNKIDLDATAFINEFHNELKFIGEIIVANNPKLKKDLEEREKQNLKGSICSFYLQNIECEILEHIYNYCIQKKYITNNAVLCFDGLMIPKDNYKKEILKEFELEILNRTGFNVNFIVKELNDGYSLEQLKESQIEEETEYSNMKKEFEKKNFKILNPITFGIENETGLSILKRSEFIDTYENMRVMDEVEDYRGNIRSKDISFVEKWLKDDTIRTYDRIDFLPGQIAPKGVYNTFKGFEAANKELFNIDVEQSLMMKHIKNICGNDDKVVKYVLDCFANMIQKPYDLTKTALLFKTIQGCGKDSLFDFIGNNIIGSKYYVVLTNVKLIFGDFNAVLENKILVVINESKSKTAFEYDDAIKDAITRKINLIVRKGKEGYSNTNNVFYSFLTNNKNAIKVEENDRRIVAIQGNDAIANDSDYFSKLYKEMNEGQLDRAFYEYLKKRDITAVNFFKDRPITKLYNDLKENNIPVLARYLCEYVDSNKDICKESASNFNTDFNFWMKNNNYNFEYSATQFGLDIKQYDGIEKKRGNIGVKYVINIETLKQYLINKKYYEILEIDEDDNQKVTKKAKSPFDQ
jgi:hypothetical protein